MSGFCPVHGPFDGPACPMPPPHTEGAQGRPVRPDPLRDDDLPTDPGGGGAGYEYVPAARPRARSFDDGEAATEIPGGRRQPRILDIEDEESTQLGQGALEDKTELAEPVSPTLGMLWVKEGRRIGKFYPLRDGTVIGRKYNKPGDLILDEQKVSGAHAKFKMEGSQFTIWDLGSTNGTFVNGHRIREATLLEENDLLKIGDTVFVVKLLEPKVRRRAAPAKKSRSRKSKS